MQVTLRAAVLRALEGHRLYSVLACFDKSIEMHDLYRGMHFYRFTEEASSPRFSIYAQDVKNSASSCPETP
jgi:hypothetical protein